jgi:hypothetical protein
VDVCQMYDAAGQLLRFETDGSSTHIRETGKLQQGALRAGIIETLSQIGVSVDPKADLDELVHEAREH